MRGKKRKKVHVCVFTRDKCVCVREKERKGESVRVCKKKEKKKRGGGERNENMHLTPMKIQKL